MSEPLNWEDGIIGRTEDFLYKRFPYNKMYCRALSSVMESPALGNVILNDKEGKVRANIFIIYVAPSGENKTPPLKTMERIILGWKPNLKAPSKFTPEAFTEFVQGTDGTVKGKKTRKEILPHPISIIIRDEFTKLFGEGRNSPYLANKEFLSELWDGYVESYYTRAFQIEGGLEPFVSLAACAAEDWLYEKLDSGFWSQGCGPRPFYPPHENYEVKRKDTEYFYCSREDPEIEELKRTIYPMMDVLNS